MVLVKFKRTKRYNDEPTIAVSSERFHYNSVLVKLADLKKFGFVTYFIDDEERKVSFKFSKERDDDAYTLDNLHRMAKGVRSSAIDLINSYPWLKKISSLKDPNERFFIAKKDGPYYSIRLRPSFEYKVRRDEKSNIKHEAKGIYRYLDTSGEIVYIGKGNIRDRVDEQQRKDWKFDYVEYSIVPNEEEQFEWENYWLLQYKEDHYDRLPPYNNNAGVATRN